MEKKTLVLDASVVVKWYCEEKDSDKALEIRERYRRHQVNIIVPNLLFYEVINAIRFNLEITEETKKRIAKNVLEIGFDTVIPSRNQYVEALNFALKEDLTIYDSIYYVIAKDADAVYVTADKNFWSKTENRAIVLLGKWN
ncbi:MAG: type II toxin-antitoxin system VapC family toxin [Thermoplasmata archaeon]